MRILVLLVSLIHLTCAETSYCKEDRDTCRFVGVQISPNDGTKLQSRANQPVENVTFVSSKMPFMDSRICGSFLGLRRLDVGTMGIEIVLDDALRGCKKLVLVSFSQNRLKTVTASMFSGNPVLEEVRLNANNIEFIDPRAFSGLSVLRKVDLRWNQLRTLALESSLPALQSLNVSSNRLVDLPVATLENLPALTEIEMQDNDFQCERLSALVQVLRARRVLVSNETVELRDREVPARTVNSQLCYNQTDHARVLQTELLGVVREKTNEFLRAKEAEFKAQMGELKAKNLERDVAVLEKEVGGLKQEGESRKKKILFLVIALVLGVIVAFVVILGLYMSLRKECEKNNRKASECDTQVTEIKESRV